MQLNTGENHIWAALLRVSFRTTDFKWAHNPPQKPDHMFMAFVESLSETTISNVFISS